MGSFHTVVAMVPCPRCGDRHYLSHQTKFFDSDYPRHDLRVGGSFEAWESLAQLEADSVWEGEWMRISDGPLDPHRVVVFDETASCGCGAGLAMLLVYDCRALAERRATLTDVELRVFDAPGFLDGVDFVDWFDLVWGSELAFEPRDAGTKERREHLVRVHATVFEGRELALGSVTCSHCGETVERSTAPAMARFDPAGSSEHFYELRAPDPNAPFVVATGHGYTGCGCGVGSMMRLLTYEPDETGYRRVRIERRHVNGVADLEDTHFVYAPAAIGHPHERSWVEHGLVAVSTRLRL